MRNVSLRHIETHTGDRRGRFTGAGGGCAQHDAGGAHRARQRPGRGGRAQAFRPDFHWNAADERRRGGARSLARRRAGHARICRHDARDQFRRRRSTFRRRDVHGEIFRAAAHRRLRPQPTESRPALSDRQSRRDGGIVCAAAKSRSRLPDARLKTLLSKRFLLAPTPMS